MLKNTIIRIVSASLLLPVFVYAVIVHSFYGLLYYILVLAFSSIGIMEYCQMQSHRSKAVAVGQPMLGFALLANAVLISFFYAAYLSQVHSAIVLLSGLDMGRQMILLFALFPIFLFFVVVRQIFFRPLAGASVAIALTLFPLLYVSIPFGLTFLLKSNLDYGVQAIFMAAASAFIADTGAYFFGILLGRHKTNFAVSPNKSWEGYLGGIATNVLGMVFLSYLFTQFVGYSYFSLAESALLGVILAVTGQIGDLAESALKRDCQIKDSGKSIPGHGGVLDLVDATLFNIPFLFLYILITG